jgi:TetR/AcrR family transcriptional repressor of nem operon
MKTAQTDSLTRQKLLDAAQELMLAKGYTATSVDEVCTAAGVTKGSFFHYFEGKEELGKVVAERFFAGMRESLRSAPFLQEADPLARVLGFVDFLIAKARNPRLANGCLLGTFVQELSETHPKIRNVCADCFEKQAAWLTAELEQAKARHAPRKSWNPRTLAEHLMAVAQGAMILAKAKRDRKVIEESLAHYKEYLQALCGV